jgi:penicillin-binding protein 1A
MFETETPETPGTDPFPTETPEEGGGDEGGGDEGGGDEGGDDEGGDGGESAPTGPE